MRNALLIIGFTFLFHTSVFAQLAFLPSNKSLHPFKSLYSPPIELYTRGYGAIIGYQQGERTFFELGGEANWRKIRLSHPHTYGVGANVEYNFAQKVLGWKASGWVKPGRIDFTYGVNLLYYSDFSHNRIGIGPALGYKLLGFHFIVGANLMAGSRELTAYNTFFLTIRYYAPIQKKTGFRKSKD
ncbi:MAG: hypothetical protein V4714_15775 [Bacteroidota bacterium]